MVGRLFGRVGDVLMLIVRMDSSESSLMKSLGPLFGGTVEGRIVHLCSWSRT